MTDYSHYTTEELENLYKDLLKERITDLRQGTNSMSKLETSGRESSSMDAVRKDVENFREEFTEMQHNLRGNQGFTGTRNYQQVLDAMCRGDYRHK